MISDQLKKAMRDSGKSQAEISKATGIADPIISRFLSEDPDAHRDIRLQRTADKLAEYFGLDLTSKGKGKRKGK